MKLDLSVYRFRIPWNLKADARLPCRTPVIPISLDIFVPMGSASKEIRSPLSLRKHRGCGRDLAGRAFPRSSYDSMCREWAFHFLSFPLFLVYKEQVSLVVVKEWWRVLLHMEAFLSGICYFRPLVFPLLILWARTLDVIHLQMQALACVNSVLYPFNQCCGQDLERCVEFSGIRLLSWNLEERRVRGAGTCFIGFQLLLILGLLSVISAYFKLVFYRSVWMQEGAFLSHDHPACPTPWAALYHHSRAVGLFHLLHPGFLWDPTQCLHIFKMVRWSEEYANLWSMFIYFSFEFLVAMQICILMAL